MFAPTFFAPTFFPPSYFAESGGSPTPVVSVYSAPSYFPPSFYAPTYFQGVTAGTTSIPMGHGLFLARLGLRVAPPVPAVPVRDDDIYDDIIARLYATNAFSFVMDSETGGPASADWVALARVIPGPSSEVDIGTPIVIERHGTYRLGIEVRDEDPRTRRRAIGLLANVAKNVLNGQSLAGATLPPFTLFRTTVIGDAGSPGQAAWFSGEWKYLVDDYDGYSVNE